MKVLIAGVLLVVSAIEASRCPQNCAGRERDGDDSCNRATRACLEGCQAGFYGSTCNSACDVNCLNISCQQLGGECNCGSGYNSRMGKCQPTNGTTCTLDYRHCLKNICKSGGREQCLYGCSEGWFGKFCDRNCSTTCICNQISGACTDCVTGWYGEECETRCSSRCKEINCHRNGSCVQGCTPGYHGAHCEFNCSEHCVSGCDQLSGECVQCAEGRYGSTCQSQCSAGCAGSHTDCDREGRCIKACGQGYFGEKCETNCPEQCYSGLCDLNGTCGACKNGFFGIFCHQTCLRCTDGICNQTTGECIKGCHNGYHGPLCDLRCEDCPDGDCHMKTGICKDKWSEVQYFVGGGVAVVIIIIIASVLVYTCISCRLKRMHGVIYDAMKWRRRPPSHVQDVSPLGAPVFAEEVTVSTPRACPIRPIEQTSYIHPRDSGHSSADNLHLHFQLGELLDRPDSYVLPNYVELNEDMMDTPPQDTRGAEAATPNTPFPVAADVHVQMEQPDGEHATGGDINIALIGECFGTTETNESPPDEKDQPDDENYDHPFREHYT